jgi:hypothetical protein
MFVGDQLLRHVPRIRRQAVKAQPQPATQFLLHRAVPIAHRGLRHLRDQRLRISAQKTEEL